MITPAVTMGGKKGRVHAEFSDESVYGYHDGNDYIPIVFPYENDFGEIEHTILKTDGKLYHNRLMRHDGGVCIQKETEMPTFSWSQLNKVPYGYTEAPDGTLHESYGYCLNRACDTALDGISYGRILVNRIDRTYWTPDDVTQNTEGPKDMFSLDQYDPSTPPFETDKCGKQILQYKSEKQTCYNSYEGGKLWQ